MDISDRPQIYLITPPEIDLALFPDVLARLLDKYDIAALRLSLSSQDVDVIARAADHVREICHPRDVAVIMEAHAQLVGAHGLDGLHLSSGTHMIKKLRGDAALKDCVIGAYCGASRHEGLRAGEAGADYICYGPVGVSALGAEQVTAARSLFEWWSDMITLPVVAEGYLNTELVETYAPVTDFFAFGSEIWCASDPVEALGALLTPLDD